MEKMPLAQLQEYWDACLLSGWRKFLAYGQVKDQWEAITGENLDARREELKRVPLFGFPYKTGIRVFTATYLAKINDRLLEQPADKDVALLKKLQTSSYNTQRGVDGAHNDLSNLRRKIKRGIVRVDFEIAKIASRNRDTDWNITK